MYAAENQLIKCHNLNEYDHRHLVDNLWWMNHLIDADDSVNLGPSPTAIRYVKIKQTIWFTI